MVGILDCNNFFVSCERLFNPDLNGKPVVVLSNNDGCIVSRSNEAKSLGIPMGLPAFKLKEITDPKNITIISGNHQLYQDISKRVMSLMASEIEGLQIYSVDECFFRVPYKDLDKLNKFIHSLYNKIRTYIGIPVSIGIAPTKTLAKIASHYSKKALSKDISIYIIPKQDNYEEYLRDIHISEVWGIGRRNTNHFLQNKIYTALDLVNTSEAWIKSNFSINEVRTYRELKGIDCNIINAITEAHKSITTSRSFGNLISDKKILWEAIASFVSDSAERLRKQESSAQAITVFIRGDKHSTSIPYFANSCDIVFAHSSCDTSYILNYALQAFNNIYKDGILYRKAGVILGQIKDDKFIQLDLFDKYDYVKHKQLMQTIDSINSQCGQNTLVIGAQGVNPNWSSRKQHSNNKESAIHIYSGMELCNLIIPGNISQDNDE